MRRADLQRFDVIARALRIRHGLVPDGLDRIRHLIGRHAASRPPSVLAGRVRLRIATFVSNDIPLPEPRGERLGSLEHGVDFRRDWPIGGFPVESSVFDGTKWMIYYNAQAQIIRNYLTAST